MPYVKVSSTAENPLRVPDPSALNTNVIVSPLLVCTQVPIIRWSLFDDWAKHENETKPKTNRNPRTQICLPFILKTFLTHLF
jgi:hypothetical protein